MSDVERDLVQNAIRNLEQALERLRTVGIFEVELPIYQAVLDARLDMAGASGLLQALAGRKAP